jgi:hypothetical protein
MTWEPTWPTIRCGVCGELGHNRRTCREARGFGEPKMKRVFDLASTAIAQLDAEEQARCMRALVALFGDGQ